MGLHIMFTLWQHGFLVFVYCSSMKCFLNSEFKLIFFFDTKNEGFFFSRFMIYYLPSAIEKPTPEKCAYVCKYYDIPKYNLFRHLFFFLIYCRNTILMRYDTTRIKTSNKIGKIIIWYMREFCEYNCIISFCI